MDYESLGYSSIMGYLAAIPKSWMKSQNPTPNTDTKNYESFPEGSFWLLDFGCNPPPKYIAFIIVAAFQRRTALYIW